MTLKFWLFFCRGDEGNAFDRYDMKSGAEFHLQENFCADFGASFRMRDEKSDYVHETMQLANVLGM